MNRLLKQKLWMDVVRLRNANLTYAEIGKLTGITRQRACQIIVQAKVYAGKHNDELAQYITESVTE